jgi:hypothetical protein
VKGDLFHSVDALPDRSNGEFTLGDLQAVWSRAITARSQLHVADRAAAVESGYQAQVAKSFDPAELARTVAGVYREHLSTS